MVYNFVLPGVEKHNMREKIRNQQQSYMQNTYISIYDQILDLPDEPLQVTDQDNIKDENIQAIRVTEDTVKIDDFPILHNFS